MERKELILKDLQKGYNNLYSALVDLKIENYEGQLDYCTAPELANLFDNIENIVKQLDKIIYQK